MSGYTEIEKIRALALLAENEGDFRYTSLQTKIPVRTLKRWKYAPATTLDTRLERLANELAATMPDKLENANLEQLTKTLGVVLSSLKRENRKHKNQEQEQEQDKPTNAEIYEKLAHLINRYTSEREASGDPEPTDAG